eukprot:GFYU01010871.1.p1 GENE.GFYU01010871.1~~GFYU01010871.1.p1  ORF type:complete len:265 (-),score=20.94 GFYU01010871.1:397-1191(-)
MMMRDVLIPIFLLVVSLSHDVDGVNVGSLRATAAQRDTSDTSEHGVHLKVGGRDKNKFQEYRTFDRDYLSSRSDRTAARSLRPVAGLSLSSKTDRQSLNEFLASDRFAIALQQSIVGNLDHRHHIQIRRGGHDRAEAPRLHDDSRLIGDHRYSLAGAGDNPRGSPGYHTQGTNILNIVCSENKLKAYKERLIETGDIAKPCDIVDLASSTCDFYPSIDEWKLREIGNMQADIVRDRKSVEDEWTHQWAEMKKQEMKERLKMTPE